MTLCKFLVIALYFCIFIYFRCKKDLSEANALAMRSGQSGIWFTVGVTCAAIVSSVMHDVYCIYGSWPIKRPRMSTICQTSIHSIYCIYIFISKLVYIPFKKFTNFRDKIQRCKYIRFYSKENFDATSRMKMCEKEKRDVEIRNL